MKTTIDGNATAEELRQNIAERLRRLGFVEMLLMPEGGAHNLANHPIIGMNKES